MSGTPISANSHRLAVKTGDDVWIYDTLDHQIGGFSQQQGGGSSIIFSSQYGTVNLSTLPAVSRNGQSIAAAPAPISASFAPPLAAPSNPGETCSPPSKGWAS